MGRRVERLSPRAVKTLGPGYHPDGGNLYLVVTKSKVPGAEHARSWILRYARGGREVEMGLGSLHTVGLAEARAKARECRALLVEGVDPLAARKARRAQAALDSARAITFEKAAETYIDAHRAGWKNAKHAAQWTNTIEQYATPVLGKVAVADVETPLVVRVLEPIWSKKPETASRLRGRIESILDWATVRGYRVGENPARWKGHLEKLLPKRASIAAVRHHAALPYPAVADFMADLREQDGVAARALEFAILTCARTSEAILARPEEIDVEGALWTVPASRMKAKREHRVPLAPRALAIVKAQIKAGGPFLFPGGRKGRPLSNMAMSAVLKRMGRDSITVHGFRSSFRDWAAEETTHPSELAEMALAHAVGDKVQAAYRRGDLFKKRVALAADWERYCARGPKANVLPMRRPKT